MFGRKKSNQCLRHIVGILINSEEMGNYHAVRMLGEREYLGVEFGVDLEKSDECKNALSAVSQGSRYVLLYHTSGGGRYHNQLVGFWRIVE